MSKLTIIFDDDKIDLIKKAATHGGMRRAFNTYSDAKAAFDAGSKLAKEMGLAVVEVPQEIESVDDAGKKVKFSPYENARAVVGVIGTRERNSTGKLENGIKGLALFPIPTVEAFLADEAEGADWLAKIVEKESAHVAFRNLRNAESTEQIEAFGASMPRTVSQYVASHRGGDGIDTESFDAVWKDIRSFLKTSNPQLLNLLPKKPDVLKAIRSTSYAKELFPDLENHGAFVYVAKLAIMGAKSWKDADGKSDPLDPKPIESWLETRDTTELSTGAEKDYSVLDSMDLGFNFDDSDGEDGDEGDDA